MKDSLTEIKRNWTLVELYTWNAILDEYDRLAQADADYQKMVSRME